MTLALYVPAVLFGIVIGGLLFKIYVNKVYLSFRVDRIKPEYLDLYRSGMGTFSMHYVAYPPKQKFKLRVIKEIKCGKPN